MDPILKPSRGRPPIPAGVHNRILDMAEAGIPPEKAIEETGVSMTKVYEIYRNRVRRVVPDIHTQISPQPSS